jgi:hypothetical protein
MPTPVLQFKRGNAEVTGTVPALLPGEPAIALNTFDFFIGIGSSAANNKFFGSHRYWERENSANSLKLKLVSNNGLQSINLRAPVGLGATFTYTFPPTSIGNNGKVLSTDESGQLSWVDSLNSLSVNDIKSGNGTVAISLSDNDVTIADNLTVQGNLYVNGNTTQVNTTELIVEDRTIELGLVNGIASSITTWDLGVLFNYGDEGTARKSAMIWEHSDARFKFAKVLDASANGNNTNTPQLTITGASNFAPIEIASLWITDCAGTSQVISCTGSERFLENITVDAGTF